jgi:Zn-finger nucleic acid-binding protein
MSDAWEDKRKAAEESYFAKKEAEALKGIRAHGTSDARKSPLSGEPMQQIAVRGVQAFRCTSSGGVWFDPGMLEKLLKDISEQTNSTEAGWLSGLLNDLMKRD